jgi:hypothetical protein
MKSIKFIMNFKLKYILKTAILPVEKRSFSRLISFLPKIIYLSFDRISRIRDRLVIANNFIQFIAKLNKNHGSTFTVKWLKSCTVALQKWLGDDKVKSLREIEPNLPLPRVINGCPSIINRTDRQMMKRGNVHIIRFWHSLFSIYRVLQIPGKLKLETITSPYSGNEKFLEDAISFCKLTKWHPNVEKIVESHSLAPTTFHFSGKASPSNVNSSQGLLSDIYLLMSHAEGGDILNNIQSYLDIIGSKWNTYIFLNRLNDGVKIIESLPEGSLSFKKSMVSPFGQFAIKREAAGKIRVFALVDSITQSVMKPIHLGLFKILRSLPNDGTFDQDTSVTRCSIKALQYNQAFSFDLSAATDRLPVRLTASIIESIFKIEGLGLAWQKVMVDRNFSFNSLTAKEFNLESNQFRYSVGQPMGCLSSWAGLAITHHWVMQMASYLNGRRDGWEDRYEVLGDDIVIFDSSLAKWYLHIMKNLGLEINLSKSIISPEKPVFDFAKRTVIGSELVSGITYSQVHSSNLSLSSRINSVYSWIKLGYLDNLQTISTVLNNFKTVDSFKDFSLMASSYMLLGLSSKNSEHSLLMKSLVDPNKGCLWDIDTENFSVPTRSLINISRDLIKIGQSDLSLSKDSDRQEWVDEGDHLIVAGILGEALYKARQLSHNYSQSTLSWSKSLVSNVNDEIIISQIHGWLEDAIIDNRNSKIIDPYEIEDKIEKSMIYHAKTLKVTLEKAYELQNEIEALEYVYKQPTKKTSATYNRLGNNFLKDMSRPFFMKGSQYWSVPSHT